MNKAFELILESLEELHERYVNQYGVVGGNPMAFAVKECKDIVQQVAEEYNGGWIPCSSGQLPKDGEEVLVWFEYFRYGEYNRLFQTRGISYTYNGKWSGFVNGSSGWRDLRIIAWQPLPEDYKPKGE